MFSSGPQNQGGKLGEIDWIWPHWDPPTWCGGPCPSRDSPPAGANKSKRSTEAYGCLWNPPWGPNIQTRSKLGTIGNHWEPVGADHASQSADILGRGHQPTPWHRRCGRGRRDHGRRAPSFQERARSRSNPQNNVVVLKPGSKYVKYDNISCHHYLWQIISFHNLWMHCVSQVLHYARCPRRSMRLHTCAS